MWWRIFSPEEKNSMKGEPAASSFVSNNLKWWRSNEKKVGHLFKEVLRVDQLFGLTIFLKVPIYLNVLLSWHHKAKYIRPSLCFTSLLFKVALIGDTLPVKDTSKIQPPVGGWESAFNTVQSPLSSFDIRNLLAKQHQELPNGHPSKYCFGQMLPYFSIRMGTGASNNVGQIKNVF